MKKTLFVIIVGLLLCIIFVFSFVKNSSEMGTISKTINIILIAIGILLGLLVLVFGGKHLVDNKEDTRKRRSSFDYKELEGLGTKLTPIDKDFIENESWTTERIENFYKYISNYFYLGRYKLFPDERNFVRDITWTDERMKHARDNSFLDRKRENYQFDISEDTGLLFYYKPGSDKTSNACLDEFVDGLDIMFLQDRRYRYRSWD